MPMIPQARQGMPMPFQAPGRLPELLQMMAQLGMQPGGPQPGGPSPMPAGPPPFPGGSGMAPGPRPAAPGAPNWTSHARGLSDQLIGLYRGAPDADSKAIAADMFAKLAKLIASQEKDRQQAMGISPAHRAMFRGL